MPKLLSTDGTGFLQEKICIDRKCYHDIIPVDKP